MVKTAGAASAAAESVRSGASSVASRRDRVSRYAAVAKMAAAIPAAAIASAADASTVYSQTGLSLRIGSGGTDATLTITGAGNASVGQIDLRSLGGSYAQIFGANFSWRVISQFASISSTNISSWFGGVPVGFGATWNNLGRVANDFPGSSNTIGTGAGADINWGNDPSGLIGLDPQQVGDAGDTWYLLFKFKAGDAIGNYGWLSFDAFVSSTNASTSYITFTGWGWSDSGAPIGAGVTASAVPGGTGLAALAVGAAGLRGRRRSRN